MKSHSPASTNHPPSWAIPLSLIYLYIAWGTTYLAIKKGVRDEHLPPALFAGSRVFLAGVCLLAFLAWRRRPLGLTGRDLVKLVLTGVIFFVGGNGMLTFAEKTVPSGVAAVLAATTPIWVAVLGLALPRGERLAPAGWLGLLLGLAGVTLLLVPDFAVLTASELIDWGPFLMIGSTLSWAVGILLLRHAPAGGDHLVSSGYQMLIGGGVLTGLGVLTGELHELPAEVTPGAAVTFLYLFLFGSLLGFIAFNFLLRHVSAALVGTHAYVNPIIAIVIGSLWDGEELSGWIAAGIVAVLAGVFLVRTSGPAAEESQHATAAAATDPAVQRPGLDNTPAR